MLPYSYLLLQTEELLNNNLKLFKNKVPLIFAPFMFYINWLKDRDLKHILRIVFSQESFWEELKMDKIKSILIQNGYTFENNVYTKDKKAYISQIELIKDDEDEKYIRFIMKRKYKTKVLEILNEKRKKTKLINSIKSIVDNETYKIIDREQDIFHCEMFCDNCETDIGKIINFDKLSHLEGFVGIHGTQNGKCVMMIDEESRDKMSSYLNSEKFCSKCEVIIIPKNL